MFRGEWMHAAFIPHPLSAESPELAGTTYRAVANARAALAALDSTARALLNPTLFRQTTLHVEAQSTAALEGTYEPLARVLGAEDRSSCPLHPARISRRGSGICWGRCRRITVARSTRSSPAPWATTCSRPCTRSTTATGGWGGCSASSLRPSTRTPFAPHSGRWAEAGYLPPRIVAALVTELGLDGLWMRKGNREDTTFPVLALRESARPLGLLRMSRGTLLVTKVGQQLVDDPRGLLRHIASRLPLGRPAERDAGILALLIIAAGGRLPIGGSVPGSPGPSWLECRSGGPALSGDRRCPFHHARPRCAHGMAGGRPRREGLCGQGSAQRPAAR